MLELNVRVVLPGPALYVWTRCATVEGPHLTSDLLQRACGVLQRRHGLAAMPAPGDPGALLVATNRPIQPLHLEEEEWELDVADSASASRRLTLDDLGG